MWFTIIIAVIWGCSAMGAIITKDSDSFVCALIATVIMGIGYFLLKGS